VEKETNTNREGRRGMKLFKKPKNQRERGQAVVEFAFILPLFLIVLFLVVEFGIGFSRWIVITNATREAARYAAVQSDSAPIVANTAAQRAIDTSSGLLDDAGATVTVNFVDGPDSNGTPGDRGDSVVVSASLDYSLITPMGAFLSLAFDSINISSCADMRLEMGVDGATDDGVTQC
jgi:hypothetical protein